MSSTTPPIFQFLFCGIVMALGWGMRGEFGGPKGAMLPGAMLGVAIALSSRRADWIPRAALAGAAGALSFGLGGMMSYGRVIGYTKGIDFPNVAYGYAMLGVIGGLWGAVGATGIAYALSPMRIRWWELLVLGFSFPLLGRLLYWFLVETLGWRMTPPRGDAWPQLLAAAIVLGSFAAWKRNGFALRLLCWGGCAGAFGFTIGGALQVHGMFLGPPFDWWKVMEQGFGFVLGLGISYGVWREQQQAPPIQTSPSGVVVIGWIIAGWLVPVYTLKNLLDYLATEKNVLRANPDGFHTLTHYHVREWVLLGLFLAAVGMAKNRLLPFLRSRSGATLLLLWILWSGLWIAMVKVSVPTWGQQSMWVHSGFLGMAILITLYLFIEPQLLSPAPVPVPVPVPVIKPKKWLLIALVGYVALTAALAYTSIATHPGDWRKDAHRRFENFVKPKG